MRRGHHGSDVVTIENAIIGFKLGSDFCSEHEWGMREIQISFGLDAQQLGFEGCLATKTPQNIIYHEGKRTTALIYEPYDDNITHLLEEELRMYNSAIKATKKDDAVEIDIRQALATAWDEKSFGIHVDNTLRGALKNLHEAMLEQKVTIGFGTPSVPVFENPGLVILDYRKIPQEWLVEARQKDHEHRKEQALYRRLEQESGVFEALKQADKGFYSLSIKLLNKAEIPQWWLNPYDQDRYHAGWFTTGDLLRWARENAGPVVKGQSPKYDEE